ncbi:TIM barrel protein [Roseospira marina]|uniref:TIM barrel protein n=1 Tax=Roseospira marina TaxID=140057 RepID=A0A5M6ID25_9PROT|nr:TIM barrel protein [Roseospira marina]KAA5606181.1 TIM barrel protein [Roseospira marina]MBB4314325.1 hydroxypyruvate isomerase [Roseospira marina]MBB5087485.1 hydroxypyruvate isomerase [Roseospira marina]
MTRFSANLGFLWTDRPLPDAIRAAAAAGFDAVECHWPYDVPSEDVAQALADTGLPMLGLNTRRGDVAAGENGLAALPGRAADARAAVDEALAYARAIGAANVHVMAGVARGDAAHAAFLATLDYAAAQAEADGITILIEPLNRYDAPGYFLTTPEQARDVIAAVGRPNVKLMFDCYHAQLMGGDLTHRLTDLLPVIGHIQFAGVPERGQPDRGEVHYPNVFATIDALGWAAPLGAEYKPGGDTDATLGWLAAMRAGA